MALAPDRDVTRRGSWCGSRSVKARGGEGEDICGLGGGLCSPAGAWPARRRASQRGLARAPLLSSPPRSFHKALPQMSPHLLLPAAVTGHVPIPIAKRRVQPREVEPLAGGHRAGEQPSKTPPPYSISRWGSQGACPAQDLPLALPHKSTEAWGDPAQGPETVAQIGAGRGHIVGRRAPCFFVLELYLLFPLGLRQNRQESGGGHGVGQAGSTLPWPPMGTRASC